MLLRGKLCGSGGNVVRCLKGRRSLQIGVKGSGGGGKGGIRIGVQRLLKFGRGQTFWLAIVIGTQILRVCGFRSIQNEVSRIHCPVWRWYRGATVYRVRLPPVSSGGHGSRGCGGCRRYKSVLQANARERISGNVQITVAR